jgi:SWI/SNF-related matrix-associated actin-dependent regulator of chromatin subfamily A member 5
MNAKFENAKHNLASFTLTGDMESSTKDTFDFGGENYRGKNKGDSMFINMGTRERKRAVYDVNEYYQKAMGGDSSGMKAHAADAKARKKRKGPHMQDFQLYDRERLDEIAAREKELAQMKEDHLSLIAEKRTQASTAPPSSVGQLLDEVGELEGMLDQFVLAPTELAEKNQLLSQGFADWNVSHTAIAKSPLYIFSLALRCS